MLDKSEYKMEFLVIESSCNIIFGERVASRLNEGWELKDDIKVTPYGEQEVIYSQAMVRQSLKEK